jgi:hypothetical protein
MRRNFPTIFVILALIILILCSACVSQPSSDKITQQTGGLGPISEESPYISFDMAYQKLVESGSNSTNEPISTKSIYYFHGTNVDESGNATTWIFGVHQSDGSELLAYDLSGWKHIPWSAPALSEEINVSTIITPERLLSKNKAVILSKTFPANPQRWNLDLIRGIYSLTIISGSDERILLFNATSGEFIP